MSLDPYVWDVVDPIGKRVVLKQSTLDKHIQGDHKGEEAKNLLKTVEHSKNTVIDPRFIYEDNEYDTNKRQKYIDIAVVDGLPNLVSIVTCVDTDREPCEVVTWTIKRDLRQEKGGIIYDAKKNK